MLTKQVKKLEEMLRDLRHDLRSNSTLCSRVDDIIDLFSQIKKEIKVMDNVDPHQKFRKFGGLY